MSSKIHAFAIQASLTLVMGLSSTAGWAERADRDKPLNIEADNLRHDELKQISVFTGKVVATKGSIVMRGSRLEVRQDPEGYQHAVLSAEENSRAFFRQKREGLNEFMEGEAQSIEYDGRADQVRFSQRAELRRLRGTVVSDEIVGQSITYNNLTEVFTVDGRSDVAAQRQRGQKMIAVSGALSASGADSRLQALHLRKSYGSRVVVQDVSIGVNKGEVVGLLGPNGAGKTTSFYMIVGLVRSDGGTISIDGQAIERLPIHRRARLGLSYLPQEASIFRKLNVQDNVRAVLELQRDGNDRPLSGPEIERRLATLLGELRVDHLRDSPAQALSGGERRRVEIARALATQPRFILLDEPFAGIDPIAVIEIQRIIGFLKSRGIGVLITDHNVRETLGICDHACIINDGRVLAQGTPAEIIDNADVRRVYLGEHFKM